MSWVAVLVAWPMIGLAVACLFGRFTGEEEAPDKTSALIALVVSHIRRSKRAKTSSRATTHASRRREVAGGRRVH